MMLLYWPAYIFIFLVNRFIFPLTIRGRENIPRNGSFILACNHLSNLDPPLISYAANRPIFHMAKASLFKNSFAGFFMRQLGSFPVTREKSDLGAMKTALRYLESGYPLAIFPAGTRHSTDTGKSAKGGVAFLAIKANVPIIPLKIEGTDLVLPTGGKKLKKNPVTITIGKALDISTDDNYEKLASEVLQRINSL